MNDKVNTKSIEDAYKILDLEVNANKEELEKRYTILIKKYRGLVISEVDTEKAEAVRELEEVTDAYNSIKEAELQAIRARIQSKQNPVFKKMGVDEYKARNFMHYHKYHIIFGIIGLLAIVYTIYSFATKVNPDFNVTAIGNFYSQDTAPMKQTIKEKMPEVKEPSIEVITIGGDTKGQQEYAMQMKAMAVMAAGDIDVFILDKENFDKYAAGGAFADLGKGLDGLQVNKDKVCKAKNSDSNEEHIYGFEVGSSSLLQNIKGAKEQKIVAISASTKNYDKALKLAELLVKN
jgi:hypothetical protein